MFRGTSINRRCCVSQRHQRRHSKVAFKKHLTSVSVKDGPGMFHWEFLSHSFLIPVSKAPPDEMKELSKRQI